MSARLTDLAQRAKSAFAQTCASRDEWFKSTLELATAVCEAREALPANAAFSLWQAEANLEKLSKDDRSALINIGRYQNDAKVIFTEYDGLSWRQLWQQIRHVRNLRRRDAAEQSIAQGEKTDNVIQFPVEQAPSLTAHHKTNELVPVEGREREEHITEVICQMIYAAQFWHGSKKISRIVRYWVRHRGDKVPSANEMRALARWLDNFAAAVEQHELHKPTKRQTRA